MNDKNLPWYELLDQLISREGFSRPQVAYRAGVKTKTITSWLRGDVKSPRRWQPLAQVLRALNANTRMVNQILQGAGHPTVHHLAQHATNQEQELLTTWLQPDMPFMPPDRLVTTLVGRKVALSQATSALRRQKRCVLLGMGGVGKTTLAVDLAHQLRYDYPDGVFWGDLRTAAADAVLESWGQACSISMERLTDFNSRATALRAVFSRKQVLIILDDVIDSQQALQMIPAQNTNSAVLVTTRSEDVARALTRRQPRLTVQLKPMNRQQSLTLLANILGEQAVAKATPAAKQIADLLGDLPLALQICAALCADAGLSLAQMATLLRELRTRLEQLRLEEKPLVRLAFEQSWVLLDERTQQGFATMAVFAGRPFHTSAFAATANLSEPEAALLLTRLCRRSLLTMTKTADHNNIPQYQQHTLLAAFAAEKLADDDPAWQRFSDYYGELVATPHWWQLASPETWGNVMAGMATAHRLQIWPLLLTYTTHLTEAWRRQGQFGLARQGYSWALEAAQEREERHVEAEIRLAWGHACLEQSAYEPAREKLITALALFTSNGHTKGVADANYHLSRVEMEQSNHEAAEAAVQKAYHAYQQEEDVRGMGRALYRLGNAVYHRGDYERAGQLTVDAIRSQQQADDHLGLLRSYMLVTRSLLQLQRVEEAAENCQIATRLIEQVDDRAVTAVFYYTYADVLRMQKSFPDAQSYANKALTLFQEMGDGSSEANALMLLAGNEVMWNDAKPQRQQFDAGLAYCQTGLAVCEAVGYELGKPFLLLMNGRLLAQRGEIANACITWKQALTMAQTLQNVWLQNRLQALIDEPH